MPNGDELKRDVVVVGAGNAALCAAHAARARGMAVTVLEKAPVDEFGGNSFYTAGAFRATFDRAEDLAPLLDDESLALLERSEIAPYTTQDFIDDMLRATEGRCDPVLTRVLVDNSADVLSWLRDVGLRFRLLHERQAYLSEGGRYRFFGDVVVGATGGGKGMMSQHLAAAQRTGIEVRYATPVTGLVYAGDEVVGVRCRHGADEYTIRAASLILAAGGFEADPEMRSKYLGQGWERAYVRGTPHNTGEVLRMAIDAGAAAYGDWSSCHSVQWDAGAPARGGDRTVTNQFTRQSYPLGIVVNAAGRRFFDEGADFRNLTYAKYGREILRQPDARAVQVFDAKTRPILRTLEYDNAQVTGAEADTLVELAEKVGVDPSGLVDTVGRFNDTVNDVPFDPAVKDGKRADVLPPKSNWAQPIDTPPYYGYPVTCGITFTFGGLHVDEHARVLNDEGRPVDGMFAAGEIVGGLFSQNYPGATGLTAGAVFGRLAGDAAASRALDKNTGGFQRKTNA